MGPSERGRHVLPDHQTDLVPGAQILPVPPVPRRPGPGFRQGADMEPLRGAAMALPPQYILLYTHTVYTFRCRAFPEDILYYKLCAALAAGSLFMAPQICKNRHMKRKKGTTLCVYPIQCFLFLRSTS